MTKLAVCRTCRKVFFTKLKTGDINLRCRNCGSRKVTAWSSQMINTYGADMLSEIFPKTPYQIPRKRKRGLPPGSKTKEKVQVKPKKPDAAPGCWGSYENKKHCNKICLQNYGEEIQKSCKA